MKIKVIKKENQHYLCVSNYNRTIHSYKVLYSWEDLNSSQVQAVPYNRNLFESSINLINADIDLYTIPIPVKPILELKQYITLILITEEGYEYPFHIDYNLFHSVAISEDIHAIKLGDFTINEEQESMYKFYIKGVYGDMLKVNLVTVVNPSLIHVQTPDKQFMQSNAYDLIIEVNGEKVHRCRTDIFKEPTVDFSVTHEEVSNSFKFVIVPKFNVNYLKHIEIYSGTDLILRRSNEEGGISNIYYFIQSKGIRHIENITIKYKILSSALGSEYIEKTSVIKYSPKKTLTMELINFREEHDFINDSVKIFWDNKCAESCSYCIAIGENKFYTKENNINIKNISSYNNGRSTIPIDVTSQLENSTYATDVSERYNIANYTFLDSSNKFIPIINYSEMIENEKPVGKINWSVPGYYTYAKVTIKTLFIERYLDEYLSPWIKDSIMNKTVDKFDEKYTDYSSMHEYDFKEDGDIKLNNVYNTVITYDNKMNGAIIVEGNSLDVPIWICEIGEKYEVQIELFDRTHKSLGIGISEFEITSGIYADLNESCFKFDRQQTLQFGETGTVGEFYKIQNPRPVDVMAAYSPDLKTFEGFELNDITNIDNDFNSLYYYFNSREQTPLLLKIKRNSNYYYYSVEIFDKENKSLFFIKNEVRGNNFEDNIVQIDKKILKEGKNKMIIKTFNSSNQESKTKELNFFVYNNIPEKPVVQIKPSDCYTKDDKLYINKKFFEMEITNNKQSDVYAGWIYKEVHFYFRDINGSYQKYPDYVIQSNRNKGDLILKNSVPVENGEYACKVIAYDYTGNYSQATEFSFTLLSEIKITPEVLYTNDAVTPFNWYISKAQESEGFYYYLKYSFDGINFQSTDPVKIDSPYYTNDPTTEKEYKLTIGWPFENAMYRLCVYEHSNVHPNGKPEFYFSSEIVDVMKGANPSKPIYALKEKGITEVFNERKHNEWAYTKDLNKVIFQVNHTDIAIDNPDTPEIEKQYYQLQVIDPGKVNSYYCDITDVPDEVGTFTFTNICDRLNLSSQKEGVWEIRFITVDKYGNSNADRGYYTYYVNIVNRDPYINNIVCMSQNTLNYFGLYSDRIAFSVSTDKRYEDIVNFIEHSEKFNVIKYKVEFTENPSGNRYTLDVIKDINGIIDVANALSEMDKVSHSRDGKYKIIVKAEDPIGRTSEPVEEIFYIDTTTDSEINFVSGNRYYSKNLSLFASATDEVYKVYFKSSEEITESVPEFSEDEIRSWDNVITKDITFGSGNPFNGISIENLSFEKDGKKCLYYVIEEESGNLTGLKKFIFSIDTITKLMPLFDLNNKVFYNNNDEKVEVTWYRTNNEITEFHAMLDKVTIGADGTYETTESYAVSVNDLGILVPVGPSDNSYGYIGSDRKFSFSLAVNSFITTGYYVLKIRGEDLYGDSSENEFMFQIDYENSIPMDPEITNNKITIDSNTISWNHIQYANYYEVSYNGKTWIKVMNNYFCVNSDRLVLDEAGKTYVYMRWISKVGMVSEISKIPVSLSIEPVETPVVEPSDSCYITDNNKKVEWKVVIKNPEKVQNIMYSFDKVKWHTTIVKSSVTYIFNDEIEYPAADGTYDIFVMLADSEGSITNKSKMVHCAVKVFAGSLERPVFKNIVNGDVLFTPMCLYIENKHPDARYYIYIDGRQVNEGYEISSSNLQRFNIEVKAEKLGIDKVITLLSKADSFHVFSAVTERYVLDIKGSQVVCFIDDLNGEFEIHSMPGKKENQVILYRLKNSEEKWNTLRQGDRLSLSKEWEFYTTTFSVL